MDNGAGSYRRFLDGDERAFDEILNLYRENLIFFINHFVHDAEASEDIAIDVFTELIVHRHRYNFKTSLKTYLYMIGRSRALDYIKHRGKIKLEELTENAWVTDHSIEDHLLDSERKRVLSTAIHTLPAEMQIIIHLIFFEELSYEDAGRVIKKNRKQVDNLLYRAKNALRAVLGEEGEMLL